MNHEHVQVLNYCTHAIDDLTELAEAAQTLTFPHNFRLQNNSLRSRLAVQKQCMGACMVG